MHLRQGSRANLACEVPSRSRHDIFVNGEADREMLLAANIVMDACECER